MTKQNYQWQIKKNILDLEYRDNKEWMHLLIIISATLLIGFGIAYLQESIPQGFFRLSIILLIGILAVIFMKIKDFYYEAKNKLEQIKKIKVNY